MIGNEEGIEMLRQEHRFVAELLGRLGEVAERIHAGEPVSPGTVRLGVGLLDAYLHRVHMHQFDRELWPYARVMAPADCDDTLERIQKEHERLRSSARELLALTSRWALGDVASQEEVARRLSILVAADHAINELEERHPFRCLATTLTAADRATIRTTFSGHARTKRALEGRIERYLRLVDPAASPRA